MFQVQGLPSFWVLFSVGVLSLTGSFQFGYQEATLSWSLKHFPELNQTHLPLYSHSFGISGIVLNMTIFAFGVGAAIGFAIFGSLHIYLLMRWAMFAACFVVISGGIAMVTGVLTKTTGLFAFGRFICGIGTGIFSGFQIIFINDVSLKEHRPQLSVLSGVTPIFGSLLASCLSSYFVLGNPTNFYLLFCITLVPVIPYAIWIACVTYEPPLTYLIINDEKRASRSAAFFHPDESVDEVLAEAYNRVRAQPSIPSLYSVWTSKLGRRTLLIALAVNLAASFAGERFPLYAMKTLFMGHTVLYFMCFFACAVLSLLVMLALIFNVNSFERRTFIMASIIGVMGCEIVIGMLSAYRSDIQQNLYISSAFIFCCLHQLCYALALGSLSWFFAAEISFAGWNAIVLATSMVARMLVSTIQPAIYSILQDISPALSSLSAVLPLLGCFLVVFFFVPEINNLEPNEILAQLGFSLELNANEDETQEVLENMYRLWTIPISEGPTPSTDTVEG